MPMPRCVSRAERLCALPRVGQDMTRLYTGMSSDASELGFTQQSRPADASQQEESEGLQLLPVEAATGKDAASS